MATRHHNISGELTQELLAAGDNARVSSISLTNARAFLSGVAGTSSTCKVDLYIEKKLSGKFYILKDVSLPLGATLSHDFTINNSSNEFGLYIKLTRGDTFTLTGTIDPAASVTVPGVNTVFSTEVGVGDEIVVSAETRTVSKITSDTSLTVTSAFSNNANDATPDCNPEAIVDVIIS